ncbi:pyridoxal-phosphate dependent enzyme [Streptomyces clavuligerus]|uniref:pyridoxal-phosphate dependent enzyme n=6 Tax=Streptomyces clavuligerus TaxID=1901 RepID=UPI00017FFD5C|nr:pyridoxal-phosphate dependent enzyme [Streptomyces clavuligerus]ANW17681.1 cysteine synthase [Streptomyces clavuligerus]AXU12231.1 pyridoxal-phosphate dependent enzyme [Streptomyces clavuligerus]EDY50591.1 cysteine synthase [Streptomyces clavuligerus]MBY6302102.1 pyridoxal-phosphate dependent enzyme [Streptomyces clavuligerus]QCS05013.1 cysteine synthase [Streptomyces clavuligerus]
MDPHISEAIGRPDLIRLDDGVVCLRFETMKVVSALAAVRHLLSTGAVRPGDTLLDSSSGIYAHALALACHRYGLRCHIVGSTTVDRTLRAQLRILGARLEQMEPTPDLKLDQRRRVARIREILAEHPEYHWMRQYHDDIHCLGYRAVADRVHESCGGRPLTLVGGVGSGASTAGLARRLRERTSGVRLVGVQPFGSVTFGAEQVPDPEIIIAGIGSSIPFGNVDHTLYDTVHWVGFTAARAGSVALLRDHAVFAGLSTGAAHLAARWERGLAPDRTVVFIAPDTGHRYVDAVFADAPIGDPSFADADADPVPPPAYAPHEAAGPDDLVMPWTRLEWNRACAPPEGDGTAERHLATASRPL